MRFVLMVLTVAPSLQPYVLELLAALVTRGVWADPQQWRGWVLAAEKTAPASFPVLLQVDA